MVGLPFGGAEPSFSYAAIGLEFWRTFHKTLGSFFTLLTLICAYMYIYIYAIFDCHLPHASLFFPLCLISGIPGIISLFLGVSFLSSYP